MCVRVCAHAPATVRKDPEERQAASQLTFANRAILRGVIFSSKVKRLMPANLERWELQGSQRNHTATWKPANCYNQGKNN